MEQADCAARSVQLRALLGQIDALAVDASTIRRKLDAHRLTAALASRWLEAMREQLQQLDELLGALRDRPGDRGNSPTE